MAYLIVKSLHVIGVVCWFAGLFYIVRLFIYHTEASGRSEPDRGILTAQFVKMERLLWNVITIPAMILTAATGGYLLTFYPLKDNPWVLLKLTLLLPLVAYHFQCGWIRKRLAEGRYPFASRSLRMYNEVPTFLLVAIVFTVVSKSVSMGLWSLAGCAAFFGLVTALFLKKMQGRS